MDLVALDSVAERAYHVLLTDDVSERARAVAAIERGTCGHGSPSLEGPSDMDRAPCFVVSVHGAVALCDSGLAPPLRLKVTA